ncbi:NAD(P)H-dependent oxidoreductase [Flavobacterium sp. MAH-1]|uniref:NAD(P)H-dependent oxidoreductase n=1 Tax=Flavobacterium agri TaxID=2743471 RepID=A0A7Y9C3Z5_9FLAO|nr:NAD(P)H-dependent oxidoreductase [Flavobacterium agri]NUY79351.1 NAD(P)H-dependent oxidoreductase [Flavobacterium agri]NYA69375.1 NAD(P)H-dependent oxidoreductase [Flavobacterium agri]
MKIFAFSGSNSSTSINMQLVTYAVSLFEEPGTKSYCMKDFEMPLFGVDIEKEIGHHPKAQEFLDMIAAADLLVISLPENNGSYSSAFKNTFDWASRIMKDVFQHKPTLLMATSPGQRGGKSVLELATSNLVRYGMDIREVFSLPLFYENFDIENHKIKNVALDLELREKVAKIKSDVGS